MQETNLGYINSEIPLRVELLCTELATLNDLDDTDMLMQAFNDMKENVTEVKNYMQCIIPFIVATLEMS